MHKTLAKEGLYFTLTYNMTLRDGRYIFKDQYDTEGSSV